MPVLKNARHERFCQELAKGKSASEAYGLAGYSPNRGSAATLHAKPSITKRVAELQQAQWDKAELTKDWIIEQLKTVHSKAVEGDQLPSANKALELMGRELGMFKDSERVDTNVTVNVSQDKPDFGATISAAKATDVAPTLPQHDAEEQKPKHIN